MVMAIVTYLYPPEFLFITLFNVVLFVVASFCITEWRAKYFKRMTIRDQEYSQKATDSLLNFETVKYFNAEEHEQHRFMKSLVAYKKESVVVANSLVVLTIT